MEDIEKHYQKLGEQGAHELEFWENGVKFWHKVKHENQQAFWENEAEQKEQSERAFLHQHISEQNESAHQQIVANSKKVSQEVAQVSEQSLQPQASSQQGDQGNQPTSNNNDEKQEQQKKMSAREKMKQQSEEMSNQTPTMTLSFSHS